MIRRIHIITKQQTDHTPYQNLAHWLTTKPLIEAGAGKTVKMKSTATVIAAAATLTIPKSG